MDTSAADYCSNVVKQYDEDRWLAAQYAQAEDRRRLIALYAFHVELKRIPSLVSEPPLGEIRLQWQREAFAEIRTGKTPRAHPVIEEVAAAGVADAALIDLIDSGIDANARPLYGEGFSTIDDLAAWLSEAEAYVDVAALRLLGGGIDETALRDASVAFVLAREGRGLAPNLADGIGVKAKRLMSNTSTLLRAAPARIAPAYLPLSLTNAYLRHTRPFPMKKRLILFRSMAMGRL